MQSIELMDEDLVNLGAFSSSVEVLEGLIDIPMEPKCESAVT